MHVIKKVISLFSDGFRKDSNRTARFSKK